MILHALNAYYDRMLADPNVDVPKFGYSAENLSFSIVLSLSGEVVQVKDLRDHSTGKGIARSAIVPKPPRERSGTKAPSYFMWDNSKYVTGYELDNNGQPCAAQKQFDSFATIHQKILSESDDSGAKAIIRFIQSRTLETVPGWATEELLQGGFIGFQMEGERRFLHERESIKNAWEDHLKSVQPPTRGQCLITGRENEYIADTHPQMRGVQGAQPAGAALVSFNASAFESYGKGKRNPNAPVSEQAAFAYTTALNRLLAPGSRRKTQMGDTTVVFWTDAPSESEALFGAAMGVKGAEEAEDDGQAKRIGQYLAAVTKGDYPGELGAPDTPFHVLGLSPNAARLSVRFWHSGTVGDMAENLGAHYRALALHSNRENEQEHPRPWWLLKELAPQRDSRNIPPLLAGQLLRSIVQNRPYPRTLLTAAIGRIRADKEINHLRACIIKAYLVRNVKQEIHMTLDTSNTDIGYRLGRLFAIVERIQEAAVPGANATVRDRFFSAASATPARTFPVILKNAQHGLAKIRKDKPGWAVTLEKAIQEILGNVDPSQGFPPSLPLEKQGMFILGYYQQRQDHFTKKDEKSED
jgi:CRISPR-associated protein Csd1